MLAAAPTIRQAVGAARQAKKEKRANFRASRLQRSDDALLTLNTLIGQLLGVVLTIEQRDDTSIHGTIEECDSFMKCARERRDRQCNITRTNAHGARLGVCVDIAPSRTASDSSPVRCAASRSRMPR